MLKSRTDGVGNVLCAISEKEEQFGSAGDVLQSVQQKRAYLLSQRTAAGFTRFHERNTPFPKLGFKQPYKGAFASTFDSFNGNKHDLYLV